MLSRARYTGATEVLAVRDAMTYSVIGDPVHVTARLEGLNKELGTTMLVTEETRTRLGDRVEPRYCGESLVKAHPYYWAPFILMGAR